jgi:hypothetical protein
MYPLVENQPYAAQLQKEYIAELEAARPQIVVYVADEMSWLPHTDGPHEILNWAPRWLTENYYAIGRVESFGVSAPRILLGEEAARQPMQSETYLLIMRRKAV